MRTLTQIKFQSLSVNCKLQTPHPNQQPFKGMISDSFLQSSESMKGQDNAVSVWICGKHSGDDGMRYLSRRSCTQFSLQVGGLSHERGQVTYSWFQCDFPFMSSKPKFVRGICLLHPLYQVCIRHNLCGLETTSYSHNAVHLGQWQQQHRQRKRTS